MGTTPKEVPEDTPEESTVESADSKLIEMAGTVISGQLFQVTDEDGNVDVTVIADFRKKFGEYLEGMKVVGKLFDEALITLRQVHGADYLKEVPYFRKPREDKKDSSNSLLDKFRL